MTVDSLRTGLRTSFWTDATKDWTERNNTGIAYEADTARATQTAANAATQTEYNGRDLPAIKTEIKAHKLNTQTDTEVDALTYMEALLKLEGYRSLLTAVHNYLIARDMEITDDSIAAAKVLSRAVLRQGVPRRKPPSINVIPPTGPPEDDA